ncbi:MAG: hypothetical protein IPN20_17410 [Haliscomenobacter sp.]|nr:hypothetical protein [Haliscomenobacter sp.]
MKTSGRAMDVDVKGAALRLAGKSRQRRQEGAGQYFTAPLIQSIVKMMQPGPSGNSDFRIKAIRLAAPGLFVSAYEWLLRRNQRAPCPGRRSNVSGKAPVWSGTRGPPPTAGADEHVVFPHGVTPIRLGDTI